MALRNVSGSIRLFQFAGIHAYLHWSWFVIAVAHFLYFRQFDNPVWDILLYVGLFAIVLLHEFGHALACRSVGGQANRIVLWPLGGIAYVQPPQRPGAVLWSIAAGPLVNVVLVPLTVGAAVLVPQLVADPALEKFLVLLMVINLGLLVFNLLPVYPLDGGQILQAILWFFMGRVKSLNITATIGLVAAVLGGATALAFSEFWLVVLAGFLGWQAHNARQYARALAQADAWRM
ncbi:MAG: site-2 protease family protein [Phycisphaeraceae bacterium]